MLMIFSRQLMSDNLSTTLIISGVFLVVGVMFLMVVLQNTLKLATNLRLGDGVFRTTLALNDGERTKGLSSVGKLDSDQALLMAFPSEGKWGVWMKDMNFPIDIVWLNSDKKIIGIVKNAPTDDYPMTYTPKTLAKYVIELPAGTIDSKSIAMNNTAIFQINSGDIR